MPHLEKVLAHDAARTRPARLATVGPLAERLPHYKKFLRIENHRLRLAHQAGGGGREICRRRVRLLDVFLRRIFTDAAAACLPGGEAADAPALDAGHRRLRPRGTESVQRRGHPVPPRRRRRTRFPREINELIKQVLYVLWDIGFKVGHATRSIREACDHANEDNISKTALVEARHIAGPRSVVRRVPRAVRKGVRAGPGARITSRGVRTTSAPAT